MYQIIVYIILIFTLVWNSTLGLAFPKKQEVKTAAVNGSLSATDSLGRQATSAGESGKQVGVFFFLWNGDETTDGPYDVTKIIAADPQAYTSGERWEAAGGGGYAHWHFWSEPLFGYYFNRDKWVLSRQCQMLTDAGVDFIVFDTTNAKIYRDTVVDLIDVWYAYLQDGWKVPKLAFYTNSDSEAVMNKIYDEIYNCDELKEQYPELDRLWFYLDGKPMIIGYTEGTTLRDDVRSYFRIKANQWPDMKDTRKNPDGFPWMEFARLGKLSSYFKNSPKDKSIMNVSSAQHLDTVRFSSSAWYDGQDHGRSWHDGAKDESEDAVLYGYNFAEQWEYAMKLDPDIVFVTGFNEWTAMRLGIAEEPIVFVDNCDEEYSRDVEPSAGRLGDCYYMQLVDYIRRFKRSVASLPAGNEVTIDVDVGFDQWDNDGVTAVYRDFKGDVFDRDCSGFGDLYYTDDSGRNDIVGAKVAQDADKLYFYVDTAEELTPCADDAWMTLFINTDGGEGYDFIVNRTSPEDGEAVVEAATEDGYERIGGAKIRFEGNKLMLELDKTLLDFGSGEKAKFTFKWADNYTDGDIMSFYTRGDAAPYGRLNWVYGG